MPQMNIFLTGNLVMPSCICRKQQEKGHPAKPFVHNPPISNKTSKHACYAKYEVKYRICSYLTRLPNNELKTIISILESTQ